MTPYEEDGSDPAGSHDRQTFLRRAAGTAVGVSSLGALLGSARADAAIEALAAKPSATAAKGIQIGKQFAGKTLSFQVEAGLQAAVWKAVAKPEWEKATGTTVNIVEAPFTEQFQKLLAATQAGGFVDCAYVFYNWLPDLVTGKALQNFEPFISKYLNTPALKREFADFIPSGLTAVSKWEGKLWGYPLDAAGLILYYRTDIFGNPKLKAKFKAKYGYDLGPPKTWKSYGEVAQFVTDELEPKVYGALHAAGGGQAYFWFFQAYNSPEFGDAQYFDKDMNATINGPNGVRCLEALKGFLAAGPPGATTIDPGRVWTDFITGKLGMNVEFSPFARWASEKPGEAPSFVPKSTIRGKFALTLPPGGTSDVIGYTTAISSTSKVAELAFGFLTWATAPDVYSTLVANPFSLVKPTRFSMFQEAKKAQLWTNQAQHYAGLFETLKHLRMEPKWLAAQEYLVAVDQACTAAYTGTPVQKALDTAAKRWNDITKRVGVDLQRKAYAAYEAQVRDLKAGR